MQGLFLLYKHTVKSSSLKIGVKTRGDIKRLIEGLRISLKAIEVIESLKVFKSITITLKRIYFLS